MDRETAMTLYYIFGGIALLFLCLWVFLDVFPVIIEDYSESLLFEIFISPFFFMTIIFLIPTNIFYQLKEKAQKQAQTQQQQQQQQQTITVTVPPPQKTQTPSESVFCVDCGFKNLGTAKFCNQCGAPIE